MEKCQGVHTNVSFKKKKFTATSKCVNQLKQGALTEPLVFDLSYNLKVENIFGTRKHDSVHKWKKKTNILTSLTSNSHSCKHSKQRTSPQTDTVHWPANASWRDMWWTSPKVNTSQMSNFQALFVGFRQFFCCRCCQDGTWLWHML